MRRPGTTFSKNAPGGPHAAAAVNRVATLSCISESVIISPRIVYYLAAAAATGTYILLRPTSTRRTSWKPVGNPGCQPGFPTSFQIVAN